ncbi:hypothetical protein FANTH_6842 [Fusarium anthophilum]|uniref:ABC transporter n=1 Tax=Fusarium anthophilum TaxID=48485 RepID=A0A8H5E442_9HYPO|nr:hypothetical protein FANTH_6842 [Fusarium anthophilum]
MKLTWILELIFITCVALYVFSSLYSVFPSSRESIRYRHCWSRARVGALFANTGLMIFGVLGCLEDTGRVRKELDVNSANVTAICLTFGSVISISWTIICQPCLSQFVYELLSWIVWTLLFTLSSPYYWVYGCISALYFVSLIMSLALPWPSSPKDASHPLSNSQFIPSLAVSWLDRLITLAASGTLSSDDAWPIDSELSVRSILARRGLQPDQLRQSLSAGMLWVLLREFPSAMCLSAIFGIINVATALAQPFFLRSLLQNRDMFSVAGLFAATVASGTTEAHLKLQLSKIGVHFRSAMTALIADRCILSTNIDIQAQNADPTLLIEVDTTKIYELIEQFHLLWMIPLQAGISVVALVLLLGWQSVLAGFLSPVIFLPLISYATSRISTHMALVMQAKDATVSLLTQVLKQVKQVKLNSLEKIFEGKIAERRAEEMERTKAVAILNGISFARIKMFLLIDPSSEKLAPSPTSLSSTSITNPKGKLVFSMRHCDISLPTAQGGFQPIIRDCNIEATSNCLLVMSGSVGCGKTTLIRSIIGDIVPTRGQFSIHGRISYAPQKPFLTSGTIRDNILFGLPFDAPFYQRVIEAVSLSSDLSRLPQGDETPMGGTGATLSGGQKSRVGLARAIYAGREVIVLDDPLAALDAQVQSHVIAEVLGPHGILKDSLRITATSSTALMSIADRLYTICDGTVACTASPTHTQSTQTLTMPDASPEEIHGLQRQPPLVVNYGSIKSNTSTQITPCDSDVDQEIAPLLLKVPSKLQSPDMGSEPVALGTYLRFLSLSKYGGWLWVMFTAALSKLFDILAVYYLKLSSQDFESQGHSTKLLYYSICALIGGSLSMIFVLVAFYVCIIPTSLSIHRQLTKGVLEAKFSFFDTHSLGQILNRFTNDINKIDTSVNGSLISLSALCITTSSSLFIMISVTPLSLLYLVPTAVVYLMIQSHYLHACRQLRRLDNLARAPILNQAAENRLGAQVIVTFNQVGTFRARVRDVIDDHIRVWAPYVMLNPWLTLRLQLLSSVLQLLSASLLLWLDTSPSTLGLAMNFLIQITSNLNNFVQMRATLEADITSAERVWSYAANVPESQSSEEQRPAPSWPKIPVINFESYSASYAAGQVPCLHDLSFSIAAGEHIAVVGRTGAGKSSLSLALLRALEQGDSYSGRITIDGIDISKVCLADLRNRITFLPQEPLVFAGTIRHNLDFAGTQTDEKLQEALNACQMSRFFNLEPGQKLLDYPISDSGHSNFRSNLSSGQIQVLALSRALVAKGNNILIMDEATAAMDSSTTTVIHDVIQSRFKDYTIIAITHDIKSATKYDKVLMLHEGTVVGFNMPTMLLEVTEFISSPFIAMP